MFYCNNILKSELYALLKNKCPVKSQYRMLTMNNFSVNQSWYTLCCYFKFSLPPFAFFVCYIFPLFLLLFSSFLSDLYLLFLSHTFSFLPTSSDSGKVECHLLFVPFSRNHSVVYLRLHCYGGSVLWMQAACCSDDVWNCVG